MPEPVAYDPNRIPRRVGYVAALTTILWPTALCYAIISVPMAAPISGFAILATIPLFVDLRRRAAAKGYHPAWAWLAPLGIIGLLVVFALPDRSSSPPRGFQVTQPPQDEIK